MSSSDSAFRQSSHPTPSVRRPFSIAELADRALHNLWDPSRGLKQWLRTADGFRKAGRSYADAGDLEAAFVEFAKAATIILEKLPTHKEYYTLLTASQRHNLGLAIVMLCCIDGICTLYIVLESQMLYWPFFALGLIDIPQNGQTILENLGELKPVLVDRYERWASRHPEEAARARAAMEQNMRQSTEERDHRHPAPDESGWQAQEAARHDSNRRREDERRRDEYHYRTVDSGASESPHRLQIDTRIRRKEDVLPAARRAITISRGESLQSIREREPSQRLTPVSAEERQRERDDIRLKEEDIWKKEEEEAARRRSREQQGILRRQQEAEAVSRAARYGVNQPSTHVVGPSALTPQRSMTAEPPYGEAVPLPLESPTSPSYPTPVTTTSPAPQDGHVRYPHLMSQHQLLQGYTPSLHSMFNYPSLKASNFAPSSLLFIPDSSRSSSDSLYSTDLLPRPSTVPVTPQRRPAPPGLAYPTLSRHSQGAPPSALQHISSDRYRTPSQESARIIRDKATEDRAPELKTVLLPRDCLPRFLSIAALNTARNRETCGLLLGKDQNGKYVVTVLLIPKQHSTSDTCTMDEEELVMQFTEERSLITLGWIHTHPSQSCFMSSVDLHTHSGFQRMLPESFAVVCAPKSTPNFGIFRLTDPPGLQTILACDAKEAFHPHPPIPIYTDADKGHVQMKDLSLEIVDLR
ncbi:hypothetical protein EDC04DRAFT_2603401 [Pisolithus marmoratus]|nr:hypothetical protein EDC04DRAFT_2603401 [Pisolithus marmoratus]